VTIRLFGRDWRMLPGPGDFPVPGEDDPECPDCGGPVTIDKVEGVTTCDDPECGWHLDHGNPEPPDRD